MCSRQSLIGQRKLETSLDDRPAQLKLCPDSMLLMQLKIIWEEVCKLTKVGSFAAKQLCLVDGEQVNMSLVVSSLFQVCEHSTFQVARSLSTCVLR